MTPGTTALVVEDEYLIALEVQRILEAAGGTAIIAAPGVADTITPTSQTAFRLAIVSVLPNSPDRLALCRSLKARGTAIVVLTSSPEPEDGPHAAEGFVAVSKPFSEQTLLAAVTAAMRDARPADPVS